MIYILIESDRTFPDIYDCIYTLTNTLSKEKYFNNIKSSEREGLNIGGGTYYNFKNDIFEFNLIMNDGEVQYFNTTWDYYIAINLINAKEDNLLLDIAKQLASNLDLICKTEIEM